MSLREGNKFFGHCGLGQNLWRERVEHSPKMNTKILPYSD